VGAPPPSDPRPARPSLRGRGREILLGEQAAPPEAAPARPVAPPGDRTHPAPPPAPTSPELRRAPADPSALPLTPEERAALLDFSPASPAYRLDQPLAAPPPPARPAPVWPPEAPPDEPPPETILLKTAPTPAAPPAPAAPPPAPDRDGLPLGERPAQAAALPEDAPYAARAEVEQITPRAAERWNPPPRGAPAPAPSGAGTARAPRAAPDPAAPLSADALPPPARIVPPGSALIERPVRALYDRAAAERDLTDLLVDDEKIRQLSAQIEALQEDLVSRAEGDSHASELYLNDLLQAAGLLRASRANYDEARALVYRVRADLTRTRRVEADIRRYRPRLVAYYVLWVIVLVGLFLLKARAVELADRLGAGSVAAFYHPILFGAAGALISSLFALDRHTAKLRDFDPVHTSSYLVNPLLGGAIGALMFALASLANEDLLHDDAQTAEYAITYLLCLVAGMNQHHLLRRLGDVLKRFGRG